MKQDLEDLFSILHDGVIEKTDLTNADLRLTVNIQYLAELIDEKHNSIIVVLHGVTKIAFVPWSTEIPFNGPWNEIFDLEIEISSATTNPLGELIIQCVCGNEEVAGGQLILVCESYEIFDESENPLNLDQLKEISTYYWIEFLGKR